MTDAQRIEAIRQMTPFQVLHLWRFEPTGSVWVEGDVGHALHVKFKQIREQLSPEEWTALSKQVGWSAKH